MATAGKEQWEKQLNLSKTKSKTLIKKKEKQKVRKKKKKNLKLIFFLLFLTRNTKRKTPQYRKRLIWMWKYVAGIKHVIYKKKGKKKNLKGKHHSTAKS